MPNARHATARARSEQTGTTIRYRRAADRRTRPQRWHDAVAELLALQAEYIAWSDRATECACATPRLLRALQMHRRPRPIRTRRHRAATGIRTRLNRNEVGIFHPPLLGRIHPPLTKVDVTRGERIGRVSSEWFSRPDDERYLSLDALYGAVRARADRATARTVETKDVRVEASRDDASRLVLAVPGRDEPIAPTHWSFGQMCSLVGAPSIYLRQLPAPPTSTFAASTAGTPRWARRRSASPASSCGRCA